MCTRPAARCASLIVDMVFTTEAAYEDIISPKSCVHRKWEKSWLVYQCEEGNPNDMYAVAVKTDATKTAQIKQ